MTRVFSHYKSWEDYNSGMFSMSKVENENELIHNCVSLLSDDIRLKIVMSKVLEVWPISTAFNLTNKGQNRKAWLGAAACCLELGAAEIYTRMAWNSLDTDKQRLANQSALEVIEKFEYSYNAKERISAECI